MVGLAEAILNALAAVEGLDYCFCGQPISAHTFWNDKIYDVQGRSCPGTTGGEYCFDLRRTASALRQLQVEAVCAVLRQADPDPDRDDQVTLRKTNDVA